MVEGVGARGLEALRPALSIGMVTGKYFMVSNTKAEDEFKSWGAEHLSNKVCGALLAWPVLLHIKDLEPFFPWAPTKSLAKKLAANTVLTEWLEASTIRPNLKQNKTPQTEPKQQQQKKKHCPSAR